MTDRVRATARLDGTSETGLLRVRITQDGPYLGQHYVLTPESPTGPERSLIVEFTPGDQFCRTVDTVLVDVWVRNDLDRWWSLEEPGLSLDSALEATRELLLLGHEVRLAPVVEDEP